MMNSLTASMFGVPVMMVAGDEGLCKWMQSKLPDVKTVPVNQGVGAGVVSIMPEEACRRIRKAAEEAINMDASKCIYPMPDHFRV